MTLLLFLDAAGFALCVCWPVGRYGDEWKGVSEQPTLVLKTKRLLLQFTPESVEQYEWNMMSSPKRFAQVRQSLAMPPQPRTPPPQPNCRSKPIQFLLSTVLSA